jgi:hypothetical protein
MRRMDRHQSKKSSRLAPLQSWQEFPADGQQVA